MADKKYPIRLDLLDDGRVVEAAPPRPSYNPFPTAAANYQAMQARAAEEYNRGNTASALGASTGAWLGGAVGGAYDVARPVIDQTADDGRNIVRFLAGLTGLGAGSGGELPASAKAKNTPAGKGAPKAAPALTARPPSTRGPDPLAAQLEMMRALGMDKVSLNQLKTLTGMVPAPAKPASAEDQLTSTLMGLTAETYRDKLAAIEGGELSAEERAQAMLAEREAYTKQLAEIRAKKLDDLAAILDAKDGN